MNIFLETNDPCPLCGSPVTHQHIRPRAYVEQSPDIDYYPRSLQWLVPEAEPGENPRLYFMQHCEACHFTAAHQVFKDPFAGSSIGNDRYRNLFAREIHSEPNTRIVALLSPPAARHDHVGALRHHLLGLRVLQLSEEVALSQSIARARYCLRIAWLYRDIYANEQLSAVYAPQVAALMENLTKEWPDAPVDERTALTQSAACYRAAFGDAAAISTDDEEMRVLVLLARINMKLGDLTTAHSILTAGREKHMKLERKYQELCREGKLDERTLGEMGATVRRMKKLLDDAKTIFDDLRGPWEQEQLSQGRKILDAHPSAGTAERREALQAAGIDQRMIMKLVPDPKPQKKRGLFGRSR